jgi:hypothetical protein
MGRPDLETLLQVERDRVEELQGQQEALFIAGYEMGFRAGLQQEVEDADTYQPEKAWDIYREKAE